MIKDFDLTLSPRDVTDNSVCDMELSEYEHTLYDIYRCNGWSPFTAIRFVLEVTSEWQRGGALPLQDLSELNFFEEL
jgi:hypothetical protein